MKNELAELVQVIQKKKEIASLKVDHEHFATRTTKKGKIKRAKEDLTELFLQYREALKNRAVFILTSGTETDKFVKLAEKNFGCFSVNADKFYSDLADQINPRLYTNHKASPGLFDLLSSHFEARAQAIGIIGFPALIFESKYNKILKGKEDLLKLTKRAFNDKIGSEVVGLDAIDLVAQKAVNELYEGKIVPIILHSEDQDLIKELSSGLRNITPNVFIVSAGDLENEELKNKTLSKITKVTKKSVEESLVKIKENLK